MENTDQNRKGEINDSIILTNLSPQKTFLLQANKSIEEKGYENNQVSC